MQNVLADNFLREISNIEKYIEYINLVENNSKDSNEMITFLKYFSIDKKIFEYKSIIISLYGLLENTISIWIQEHAKNISIIVNNFNNLEESFQNQHFTQSIKLIANINENKYSKFDGLDKKDILRKLNSTICTPTNFVLNSEAYIPISGNLKHSKIVEAFKPLEINFDSKLIPYSNKIDELVSRRNDIAHGQKIDDILDFSMYSDFIDSLKEYMTIIFETINEKELEYQSIHQYEQIQTIHNVIDNSILLFELQNNSVKIGDFIIIKSAENVFFKRKIIDIQIDQNSVTNAQTDDTLDIGINLGTDGKNIKDNQTYYIKKA